MATDKHCEVRLANSSDIHLPLNLCVVAVWNWIPLRFILACLTFDDAGETFFIVALGIERTLGPIILIEPSTTYVFEVRVCLHKLANEQFFNPMTPLQITVRVRLV